MSVVARNHLKQTGGIRAALLALLTCSSLAAAINRPQKTSGREWMDWARQRGARRLGEVPAQAPEPVQPAYPFDPTYIGVFSALHDTVAGEIRVIAEVAREGDCLAMTSCTVRHRGTFELQKLTSTPLMPFGAFNKDHQRFPEMRECFLVITLPSANMSLSEITIDLANKNRTITAVLEEIETLPLGKSKGLGMCVGPLFSEAPFFADFLTWYLELGVDRFFMYASHTDWLLKWDPKYYHFPGSRKKLQIFHHHAIDWRLYHPEHASKHYYGQWLMYNDCLYRARNTMELLMFQDRDEFINIRRHRPRTNLRQFFLEQFDKPEIASVAYWHARYFVHCKMDKVQVMDALPDKPTTKNPENPPLEVMRYWGYSIWDPDHREPNFTSCNQYDCHPKCVVKPKAVKIMSVHWIAVPEESYTISQKNLPPRLVFGKHISCKAPSIWGGDWDEDPNKMLCFKENLEAILYPPAEPKRPHAIHMCPQEEINAYLAGKWPINRTLALS
ncbi:g9421 [Coccomyxa elongata]